MFFIKLRARILLPRYLRANEFLCNAKISLVALIAFEQVSQLHLYVFILHELVVCNLALKS